jgi:hypothetical protein
VSKALAMSTASTEPRILLFLQKEIVSQTLIRTSWTYLFVLYPFWALLQILFTTEEILAFIALERILYILDSNEIGLQFFNWDKSPFFGISFMHALLKFRVRFPVLKQWLA